MRSTVRSRPVDTANMLGISLKRTLSFPKNCSKPEAFHCKKAWKGYSIFFPCASYNFHFKGSRDVNPLPPMDPKIIQPQPPDNDRHQGTHQENSLHPKCLPKKKAAKKANWKTLLFLNIVVCLYSQPLHILSLSTDFPGLWVTLASLVHRFSPLDFAGLLSLL